MTVAVVREPLFRRAPSCRTTFGDLARQVAVALELPPDDEQQDALDAIFAERAPNEPAARHAAVIGARQNIKTSTLEIASATDLLVLGIPGAVWTAHESKTATKSYQDLIGRLLRNEDYASLIDYRSGRGEETIYLRDDPSVSLEYRARSGGSGRGFTTARLTLDEALYLRSGDMGALLPTMLTRRDAQVRYGSSGGFAFSEVLRDLRRRAHEGTDPRLFYVEYGAERRRCADDGCSHVYGMVEGCALDDRELWWQANSALWCGRIDEENILDLRRSMPPEEFMREVLVWWDEPLLGEQVITEAEWLSCMGRSAPMVGRPAFAIDVALDQKRASLGVSYIREDAKAQVELIACRSGRDWLWSDDVAAGRSLKEMCDDAGAHAAVAAGSPAEAVIPSLEAAGVPVDIIPRADVSAACASYLGAIRERTIVHLEGPHGPDRELLAATISARLRPGESVVWTRKGAAHISPLYAVTLARWVAATKMVDVAGSVW